MKIFALLKKKSGSAEINIKWLVIYSDETAGFLPYLFKWCVLVENRKSDIQLKRNPH
jgi:hypothetical protein